MKFMLKLAAALVALGGPAAAADEPLAIATQGNFFVGGREVKTDTGTVFADAMYVQFQIPAERKHPWPLILIHGGASSGSYFWSAPDGREGWATQFVRMGYAVYVVDRPTLGRSPYYPAVDGPRLAPPSGLPATNPADPPLPLTKKATRRGESSDARQQQASQSQSTIEVPFGAPGDPLEISTRVDLMDQAAGAALLDRIGPAVLITHSRAGTSGWLIADARPELVKAIVAVEPNGPPFYNAPPLGKAGDTIARPFAITYAPMTYSPAVRSAEDFGKLHQAPAPDAYKTGCWLPAGEQPKLTNLTRMPVMVLTGGASYHAAYDYCTAAFLKRSGVPVERVQLDDIGIEGNTHGMMGETNNGEIAQLIAGWLVRQGD